MTKNGISRLLIGIVVMLSAVMLTVSGITPQPKAHAAVSGFVTRSGSHLVLNGNTFRASGPNMFYLGLDEGIGNGTCNSFGNIEACDYPSQYRVDDAMATAQEMGATVVRAHTLAMTQGCALCIEPSLGVFNDVALEHVDYVIKSASAHGIRLITEFVDNYKNFNGGKHNFTDWRGLTNEDDFYTNTTVISDFEQYISHILNHVNIYTGIAYKDDPTFLGWGLGNELYSPSSWTSTIATYVKSIDSNHLIIDGYRGINTDDLSLTNVDIIDDHYYPMSVSTAKKDAAQVHAANKAYLIGEYDWNSYDSGGDTLANFLSEIESDGTDLDTYWLFWPHNDTYGFRQTGGYDFNYPGSSTDMQTKAQQLRTHAYKLQGITTLPADGTPATPLITSINGNQIAWRGAALAATYSVERSPDGVNNWTVVCNQCATDYQTPWTDSSQPTGSTLYYRVRGYNLSNVAGPYSPVYQILPNLAAGATATASSSVENLSYGWGLQYVNDGKRNSTVNSSLGWISSNSTGSDHNESISFNLGAARTIGTVMLYPRNDSGLVGTDFPVDFTIDVSTTGSGWTTVVQKNGYPMPSSGAAQVFTFAPQTVQYVRVYGYKLPGNDFSTYRMAFAEVEVYAPVNLARAATATASSSVENLSYGWGLQYVNDGKRTSTVNSSLGWISSNSTGSSHTETLTLNLGSEKTFTYVDLYPRNDSGLVGTDFPVDFTIDISGDGISWEPAVTKTAYATPTDGSVQRFSFATQTVRYVRVQGTKLPGNDYNTYRMAFAEIEVY